MSRQQHRVQDLHCGLSRQRCKSVLFSVYPIPISCSRFSESGKQERIWRYGLGMAMELSINLLGNKFKSKPDGPFSTCPRLTQDLTARRLFPERRSRAKRVTQTKRIFEMSSVTHGSSTVCLLTSHSHFNHG